MINDITLSYLIFLLPLLTFIVNGLFLGNRNAKAAAAFAIACNGLAAASAITVAIHYFCSGYAPQKAIMFDYEFLPFAGSLVAKIGMLVDPLSIMMLVVVTFISFMVNIYSVGYMREDRAEGRFFSLLSLFSFSMLGLVAATNLFQMFIFWELVGVSSYLLIGFWYHKPSAVSASKQAFILTRFADSFFLLGIVLVSYVVGSFDFSRKQRRSALYRFRADFHRRLGQVRHVPDAYLAPERDGRSDPCQFHHSQRHDGGRGRLPRCTTLPVLCRLR